MKKKLAIILSIIGTLMISGLVIFLLVWNGVILLNNPSKDQYPVLGVDVSAYQGEIDWETLAKQDISFAFIKATEGSSFVDNRFAYNYSEAKKTDLRVGAYHFFSYDSSGKQQAEHFIETVEAFDDMLPPVIDLEFYADYFDNPKPREEVTPELDAFIAAIKKHYGMSPIIYATELSYELYLEGAYEDCDIWIRDVVFTPQLTDGRDWTFWQYTNRDKLNGYVGEEKFIDVNVFFGSKEEFEKYAK